MAGVPPPVTAAPPPLFSHLYGDATLWDNPDPDYLTLINTFGSGMTPAAAPETQAGLAALSTRAPIVLTFVTDSEPDHVYIGHLLTIFPADITDMTALDGHLIALVGDSLASAVPVALPTAFITRTAGNYAKTTVLIHSATGHAAIPPVWHTGPHTLTTANTNSLAPALPWSCLRTLLLMH